MLGCSLPTDSTESAMGDLAISLGERFMDAKQYPVILYLNQKYALDIMAMMEGGFSQIETQTSTRSNEDNKSHKIAGGIGLSNVFGLIRMSLDNDNVKSEHKGQTTEVRTDKIHTPNSLFAKMRERLHAESLIRTNNVMEANPGEFIEFNATLQKNSLVHAIEIINSLMKTAVIFSQPQAAKGKKDHSEKDNSSNAMLKQLEELLEQLNSGDTVDLMGIAVRDPDVRVVVSLDRAFLRDNSMSDLDRRRVYCLRKSNTNTS